MNRFNASFLVAICCLSASCRSGTERNGVYDTPGARNPTLAESDKLQQPPFSGTITIPNDDKFSRILDFDVNVMPRQWSFQPLDNGASVDNNAPFFILLTISNALFSSHGNTWTEKGDFGDGNDRVGNVGIGYNSEVYHSGVIHAGPAELGISARELSDFSAHQHAYGYRRLMWFTNGPAAIRVGENGKGEGIFQSLPDLDRVLWVFGITSPYGKISERPDPSDPKCGVDVLLDGTRRRPSQRDSGCDRSAIIFVEPGERKIVTAFEVDRGGNDRTQIEANTLFSDVGVQNMVFIANAAKAHIHATLARKGSRKYDELVGMYPEIVNARIDTSVPQDRSLNVMKWATLGLGAAYGVTAAIAATTPHNSAPTNTSDNPPANVVERQESKSCSYSIVDEIHNYYFLFGRNISCHGGRYDGQEKLLVGEDKVIWSEQDSFQSRKPFDKAALTACGCAY